jgi:hypothetical protein
MAGNGELAKLSIWTYENPGQEVDPGVDDRFDAYYNPTTFSSTFSLKYADETKIPPDWKFNMKYVGYEPATYAFELLLDGTGASIPAGADKSVLNVDSAIDKFYKKVYGYDSKTHRARYLVLTWGKTLRASVVLTSVTVTKDLFDSEGLTLRAKLNCQFKEYSTKEQTEAEKNSGSPDMTHLRIIKQGDRLPIMCEEIYGDDRLYLQVANYNRLSDYRNLAIGQKIFFPPLKSKT